MQKYITATVRKRDRHGRIVRRRGKARLTGVSVMPGSGERVEDRVKHAEITWPIIRDTADNALANRWRDDWIYLIDHKGVIRAIERTRDPAEFVETIRGMVLLQR